METPAQPAHHREPVRDRSHPDGVRRAAVGRARPPRNTMRAAGRRCAAAFGIAFLLCAADAPPEPDGYRMDDYRSPVPATLRGATVLSTNDARAHWDQRDAAFIDVLPQVPRPAGLPASTIWRDKPREDVPGSIWLPDTGYGALAPVM